MRVTTPEKLPPPPPQFLETAIWARRPALRTWPEAYGPSLPKLAWILPKKATLGSFDIRLGGIQKGVWCSASTDGTGHHVLDRLHGQESLKPKDLENHVQQRHFCLHTTTPKKAKRNCPCNGHVTIIQLLKVGVRFPTCHYQCELSSS